MSLIHHKIPRATLHEDIKALEREHEIVVTMVPNEDRDFYDVWTRYCSDHVETRGGAA